MWKPSKNYFDDQFLPLTSPVLTELDFDLTWMQALWGGVLNLDLGYSRGLTWFGATVDQ